MQKDINRKEKLCRLGSKNKTIFQRLLDYIKKSQRTDLKKKNNPPGINKLSTNLTKYIGYLSRNQCMCVTMYFICSSIKPKIT